MKKKLLTFAFIFYLLTSVVHAQTIKVIALNKFSTKNPSSEYQVQIIKTEEIAEKFLLETGTIISGYVTELHKPKRGKVDSYFEFQPTSISYEGQTTDITQSNIVGVIVAYKPINPQSLVGNVAIKAANFFVLGSSQAISFTLGAAQAKNGNRIKSGLQRVYKDSFVSFIEPGKELEINTGDILVLKLKKYH